MSEFHWCAMAPRSLFPKSRSRSPCRPSSKANASCSTREILASLMSGRRLRKAIKCTISQGRAKVHLWLNATGVGAELFSNRLSARGVPFFRSAPVPLEQLAGLAPFRGCPSHHAQGRLCRFRDAIEGLCRPRTSLTSDICGQPRVRMSICSPGQAGLPYWRVACGDVVGFARALESLEDRRASRA